MTNRAISAEESWPIGSPSAPETSWNSQVIYREFGASRPLPLANSVSLASVITEFESDPEMAQQIASARKTLAQTIYSDEPDTLSALRLAAGFSQSQLANAIGTSQPHIARIERGQTDPGTSLISRIAGALGVDETRAYLAIRRQLSSRVQSS